MNNVFTNATINNMSNEGIDTLYAQITEGTQSIVRLLKDFEKNVLNLKTSDAELTIKGNTRQYTYYNIKHAKEQGTNVPMIEDTSIATQMDKIVDLFTICSLVTYLVSDGNLVNLFGDQDTTVDIDDFWKQVRGDVTGEVHKPFKIYPRNMDIKLKNKVDEFIIFCLLVHQGNIVNDSLDDVVKKTLVKGGKGDRKRTSNSDNIQEIAKRVNRAMRLTVALILATPLETIVKEKQGLSLYSTVKTTINGVKLRWVSTILEKGVPSGDMFGGASFFRDYTNERVKAGKNAQGYLNRSGFNFDYLRGVVKDDVEAQKFVEFMEYTESMEWAVDKDSAIADKGRRVVSQVEVLKEIEKFQALIRKDDIIKKPTSPLIPISGKQPKNTNVTSHADVQPNKPHALIPPSVGRGGGGGGGGGLPPMGQPPPVGLATTMGAFADEDPISPTETLLTTKEVRTTSPSGRITTEKTRKPRSQIPTQQSGEGDDSPKSDSVFGATGLIATAGGALLIFLASKNKK